jgi:D-serine deaminase-like pyridoxal phosphate-dependent protein
MAQLNALLHKHLPRVSLDATELTNIITPVLAIYPDVIDNNIDAMRKVLGGDVGRWQPHIKTSKLLSTMMQLCSRGVRRFKCATTLELLTACRAGAEEVLVAYSSDGPRAQRIQEIAAEYPSVAVAATVENEAQVGQWIGSGARLYIDINSGMNRTGIEIDRENEILALARLIVRSGIRFGGLHYYEGHMRQLDIEERKAALYPGYEHLVRLMRTLQYANINVDTVVTSGTPALPCALSFAGMSGFATVHRLSSGTLVYGDLATQAQLPSEWGFELGAIVISTVVSHPAPGLVTVDAGHKAVSSDAGVPNCIVLGHPELEALRPSEELLPLKVLDGAPVPTIGTILYLAPLHVCTTVNNFDDALIVQKGKIVNVADVTARGRESPVLPVRNLARRAYEI